MEATIAVRPEGSWIIALRDEHDVNVRILDMVETNKGVRDLVDITLNDKKDNIDAVIATVKELPMVVDFEIDTQETNRALAAVTVRECICCTSMRETGCFMISAYVNAEGWLEWNLIFTERKCLQNLIFVLEDAGCKVKLKKIANVDDTKMLTAKQEDIIRTAYARGYYDFPKRIGVRELAEMFGISTATLSEILRRGQKKIIEQYLDMPSRK